MIKKCLPAVVDVCAVTAGAAPEVAVLLLQLSYCTAATVVLLLV